MRRDAQELRTVLAGAVWTADEARPVLTVADLLAGLEVRLLTGEASAELPIRWVHISELLDPTPWMSGGEILLTTGMLLEEAGAQREFITRLADHGLAALGFGTGFRHEEVPGPLLEAAAERGLPVFEVPYDLPFIAITEAAFTRLVNEQYAILRRALAALERLERIVLSERGLEALAAALSPLIGASVIVLGARGERLAHSSFRRVLDEDAVEALAADVAERALRREARVFIPAVRDDEAAIALAVAVEEAADSRTARAPLAWLVAVKDTGPFSDFDRLTLHQAVPLIALELLRARVAGDTERRLAGDVLASLLTGDLRGAEAGRRLAPFGLGEQVIAIVCSTSQVRRVGSTHVADALHPVLRSEAGAAVVARVDGLEYALIPGLGDDEALEQAERVGRQLADRLGADVRIGVGRGVAAAEARRSFNEARCALETLTVGDRPGRGGTGEPEGDAAGGPRGAANGNGLVARPRVRVAGHRDIGSFRLLLSLQDDESLKVFCDSILEPLEAADGQYGEELIRSLEAFIDENGQWERAARRLPCHRHTLRYRIRRVEELTGRDLSNARDRIDFWLALRGRELVT